MIEVFVESIRVNMTNYKRVVMLKEKAGDRYLPVWIGHFEADSIAIPMQNVPTNRPLTHDMLIGAIDQLGGRCMHAAINRLEDETFYAMLVADQGGKHLEIDCRPSDAIATAVRVNVPIYVDDGVMDVAGMTFEPDVAAPGTEGGTSGVIAEAETVADAAAARADSPPPGATDQPGESADPSPTDDLAESVPYWPGAEPAAGAVPSPFETLTAVSEPVLAALRWSVREAIRRRRPVIGPGDLLLGLLRQKRGASTRVLTDLSVEVDELQTLVRQELSRDHPSVVLTLAGHDVLLRAIEEANRLDERTVGAEHLLLALAGESRGSVPAALEKIGLTLPAIRRQIAVLLAQAASQDAPPPESPGDEEPA